MMLRRLKIWILLGRHLKGNFISCLFVVLIAELFNSAIEALADRISEEQHPLIKQAKDIGSAAVLVALCYTVLVWLLVLCSS